MSGIGLKAIVDQLESNGAYERWTDVDVEAGLARLKRLIGMEIPPELTTFYKECVALVAEGAAYHPDINFDMIEFYCDLAPTACIPVFSGGTEASYGVLIPNSGALSPVYCFDVGEGFELPETPVADSIAEYLLLAEQDFLDAEG